LRGFFMRNVMTPRKSALLIYVETKNNRSFGIVRMTVKVPPMFGRISLV
jgi:hypothetical protein